MSTDLRNAREDTEHYFYHRLHHLNPRSLPYTTAILLHLEVSSCYMLQRYSIMLYSLLYLEESDPRGNKYVVQVVVVECD